MAIIMKFMKCIFCSIFKKNLGMACNILKVIYNKVTSNTLPAQASKSEKCEVTMMDKSRSTKKLVNGKGKMIAIRVYELSICS